MRKSAVKRWLNDLCRAGLLGLCISLINYVAAFCTADIPRAPPQRACTTFFQDGFPPRGLGSRGAWHYIFSGGAPFFLNHKEPFCTCVDREVLLSSRMGNMWSLDLLLKQDLALLYLCHNCYLKVNMRKKAKIFSLFLWLLLSQNADRTLMINI